MDAIFVDTSAYYAIFDKSDKNHARAVTFLKTNVLPLVTTNLERECPWIKEYRLDRLVAREVGEAVYL